MKNDLGIVKVFLAEFITKQAQQTGHLTDFNHHNSVLVAIELKGYHPSPKPIEYPPQIERLHLTVTHLFTLGDYS